MRREDNIGGDTRLRGHKFCRFFLDFFVDRGRTFVYCVFFLIGLRIIAGADGVKLMDRQRA